VTDNCEFNLCMWFSMLWYPY